MNNYAFLFHSLCCDSVVQFDVYKVTSSAERVFIQGIHRSATEMISDTAVVPSQATELRIYPSFTEIRQEYDAPQVSDSYASIAQIRGSHGFHFPLRVAFQILFPTRCF